MTMIPLYSHLLILSLLVISSARVLNIRQTRMDSLVLFVPFSLLILLASAFAWGYGTSEIILTHIIFIAILVNYKSFFRFCNHLVVDSYSVMFTISSLLVCLISIGAGIFFIVNKPVYLNSDKLQVKTETQYLSGTLENDFSDSENLFNSKNMRLTVYYPDPNKGNYQNDYAVLFVPDKRTNLDAYDPFLKLLAKSGYKVYAGDFGFSTVSSNRKIDIDFIRRTELKFKSKKLSLQETQNEFLDAYAKEYEIISKIADEKEPVTKKFIIIADEGPALSAPRIKNPARKIKMFHNISFISEYKTAGYGFIQQSDPIFAKFGYKLSKDKTLYTPSYVVMKINSTIKSYEKEQEELLAGDN